MTNESEHAMPKLHERIDGSFYIRIFRGEDKETGELFIGTWQLSAKGEDRLHSYGIHFDDDDIPMHVFNELRDNREIWNDSSISSPRPKRRRKSFVRKRTKVPAEAKRQAMPSTPPPPVRQAPTYSARRGDIYDSKPQGTKPKQEQPDLIQQIVDLVRSWFR